MSTQRRYFFWFMILVFVISSYKVNENLAVMQPTGEAPGRVLQEAEETSRLSCRWCHISRNMAGLVGSFASEAGEFGDFTEADCVMMNNTHSHAAKFRVISAELCFINFDLSFSFYGYVSGNP